MRLEVALAGIVNRLWTEGDDTEETMRAPLCIKWLHCEFAHCAEHQECVLEEEVVRSQMSMTARAIYMGFLVLGVFSIVKFTLGDRKLDTLLTNTRGTFLTCQLARGWEDLARCALPWVLLLPLLRWSLQLATQVQERSPVSTVEQSHASKRSR